jgi:hypothetical protein
MCSNCTCPFANTQVLHFICAYYRQIDSTTHFLPTR